MVVGFERPSVQHEIITNYLVLPLELKVMQPWWIYLRCQLCATQFPYQYIFLKLMLHFKFGFSPSKFLGTNCNLFFGPSDAHVCTEPVPHLSKYTPKGGLLSVHIVKTASFPYLPAQFCP
jgi:hypothetical protein